MLWFLVWALIPVIIYGAAKGAGAMDDWSDGAAVATVGIVGLLAAILAVIGLGLLPFLMMPETPNKFISLEAVAWQCGRSEAVIEPVRHMVGKIIVTRYEPVTECLRYDRKVSP